MATPEHATFATGARFRRDGTGFFDKDVRGARPRHRPGIRNARLSATAQGWRGGGLCQLGGAVVGRRRSARRGGPRPDAGDPERTAVPLSDGFRRSLGRLRAGGKALLFPVAQHAGRRTVRTRQPRATLGTGCAGDSGRPDARRRPVEALRKGFRRPSVPAL